MFTRIPNQPKALGEKVSETNSDGIDETQDAVVRGQVLTY